MFESEVTAFCAMQASGRTRTEYRKDLDRWFAAGLPLSVDGVTAYKRMLESKYAEASAGRFWSTARSFHRWLVNRGLLEASPFEVVKAPKRRNGSWVETPADNIVDALVAHCRTPRERAVIMLLLSGLRSSEVTDLKASSVHFNPEYGYYLHVVGKGNKQRIVPIGDEVIDAINAVPEADTVWLVHTDGKKLTYDTVNNIVDSVARRARVKVTPHQLRHHYATRLVRAGVNVIALSKLLGHANVSTTERYVAMDLSDLVEASRLDPRRTGGLRLVEQEDSGPIPLRAVV